MRPTLCLRIYGGIGNWVGRMSLAACLVMGLPSLLWLSNALYIKSTAALSCHECPCFIVGPFVLVPTGSPPSSTWSPPCPHLVPTWSPPGPRPGWSPPGPPLMVPTWSPPGPTWSPPGPHRAAPGPHRVPTWSPPDRRPGWSPPGPHLMVPTLSPLGPTWSPPGPTWLVPTVALASQQGTSQCGVCFCFNAGHSHSRRRLLSAR